MYIDYFSKKNTTQNGFTLVETLVGLAIFMIAFVALTNSSASSLQDINQIKRRLTAQYLAEEGVEYVKQIQKSYILQAKTKDDFINDFVNSDCSLGCDFYVGNSNTMALGNGVQLGGSTFTTGTAGGADPGEIGVASESTNDITQITPLRYHPYGAIALDGVYSGGLADSEFKRVIKFTDISTVDSQAVEVTSSVYFTALNSSANVNENSAVVKGIIHFDF